MLEGLMIGLSTAFSLTNILMVIGGCLIGTFIGMLPGLGPMSIIAIMIPVAITLGDPSAALILLAGVYYGAIFGGSTSSILLNAPGVAGTIAAVSTLSFGLGLLTPSLQAQVSLEARAQGQAAGQLSAATGLAWIVGPAAGLTLHGVFGAAILPAAAALLLPFAAALAGRIAVQAR